MNHLRRCHNKTCRLLWSASRLLLWSTSRPLLRLLSKNQHDMQTINTANTC